MEEAILDHGFDRLRFFLFFVLFFFPSITKATTFGPFPLASQLRNAEFILHAKVQGSSWVEMDARINRPFTYWKVQVIDEVSSHPAGDSVDLRSPGGEINGFGYHIAGSAKFSEGEEIFVIAKSSDRNQVLDIVGLASGKYVVETGADGNKIVRSSLGFPVMDANGKPFSPEGFLAYAKRVKAGKETMAERNIILNKNPTHSHGEVLVPSTAHKREQESSPSNSPSISQAKPVESSQINADEPNKGSSNGLLLIGITITVFLIGAVILYKKH